MNKIADFNGRLLNHVEAVYRPGERDLAIEMAQALGLTVTDTGFRSAAGSPTFLAVHPCSDDCDPANNVFYVSEMTNEHQALDKRLGELLEQDPELAATVGAYTSKAVGNPSGIPHFGIRYRSFGEVEEAAKAVAELAPKLAGRPLNFDLFKPKDAAEPAVTQSFLYQDVIVAGPSVLGQLIELQSHRPR